MLNNCFGHPRIPHLRDAFLCLALGFAGPTIAEDATIRDKSAGGALSLVLRREIPLQHARANRGGAGFQLLHVVAMHPDAKRAAVLVPGERPAGLQRRPTGGLTGQRLVLAWVDLSNGQFSASRDLVFSEKEVFGFSMDSRADHICVVAGQRIMILDQTLSEVAARSSEITDPQGEKRVAASCAFAENTPAVLVNYVLRKGKEYDWRSSLMQWNWVEGTISLYHWDALLPDALPLRDGHVLILRRMPGWLFRYAVEQMSLKTREVPWSTEHNGFSLCRLVRSSRLLLSVSAVANVLSLGSDDPIVAGPSFPKSFRDRNNPPGADVQVSYPERLNRLSGYMNLATDDRVVVWELGSKQREIEFQMRDFVLHWPVTVAHNETWFAVRAVKFTHFADDMTLRWRSNQFVIFSLDGSKRRLYLSEKFGPDEGISGLAVSKDDRTLLVATSRRLLVYDVRAGEARK